MNGFDIESLDRERLIQFLQQGMNCQTIGKLHGVSRIKINWLIKKFAVDLHKIRSGLPEYYVYTHSYSGIVFYVGSAQGDPLRLWNTNGRSEKWKNFVELIGYDYNAQIIEVCNNRNESQSREHHWGRYYKDKGQAELWVEDVMCDDRNPTKNRQGVLKANLTKQKNREDRDSKFREHFLLNSKDILITKHYSGGKANQRKTVLQKLENGEIVNEFSSIKLASEAVGITFSSISRACKYNKPCKGFYWSFKYQ